MVFVIEAFLAVAVRVEIPTMNKRQGRESTKCRTKTAIVYPEIECTSEKSNEQMNFEVTQLKFIRYDSTFFRSQNVCQLLSTKLLCSLFTLKDIRLTL